MYQVGFGGDALHVFLSRNFVILSLVGGNPRTGDRKAPECTSTWSKGMISEPGAGWAFCIPPAQHLRMSAEFKNWPDESLWQHCQPSCSLELGTP